MTAGLRTVIYPVTDLAAATQLYRTLLGRAPTSDQPYYVGFDVDGQEVGLDPNGDRGTGPIGYWHVADVRRTVEQLVADGARAGQPVRDVGGGKLIATVTDADGNVLGLLQPS
jgi:predicted enzyme related to lactoylglutathione lyase